MQEPRIAYLQKKGFDFIAEHYVTETRLLQDRLQEAVTAPGLLEISKRAFYLQAYLDDTIFFGYQEIFDEIGLIFAEKFGSADVLNDIQRESYTRALSQLSGQIHIGENDYVLEDGKTYYRTLRGGWYEIAADQVLYLLPKLTTPADPALVPKLESAYHQTTLDHLFQTWQEKRYSTDAESYFLIEEGTTTPEVYFDKAVRQVEALIKQPVDIETLDKLHSESEHYLENLCKVSYRLIQFIQPIRKPGVHALHLLRDGMMFAEAQKALDILTGTNSSSGQIMIGRKLLSSPNGKEQDYWFLAVDAIYEAIAEHSTDFPKFYDEYVVRLREIELKDEDLHNLLKNLAEYIRPHIQTALDNGEHIIVVDTGLQGSVNLLTKYIIDSYILPDLQTAAATDIYMFVVGDWFKGLYAGKYASDYYPMMKDIEVFARSEHVYNYKRGSFEAGKLEVEMGSAYHQLLGNIELIVLVTMAILMHEQNLL